MLQNGYTHMHPRADSNDQYKCIKMKDKSMRRANRSILQAVLRCVTDIWLALYHLPSKRKQSISGLGAGIGRYLFKLIPGGGGRMFFSFGDSPPSSHLLSLSLSGSLILTGVSWFRQHGSVSPSHSHWKLLFLGGKQIKSRLFMKSSALF